MITVRPGNDRGHFDHGWLDTRHTFSFGDYYDPGQIGFRSLRVINEDWVQPGMGFGTHPHRDMEIVTYILEGALEHRDSMGNGSIIGAGQMQRMTAGTGITHSEFNASPTQAVHLYQIWIKPISRGLEPSYEQLDVGRPTGEGGLRLVASQEGDDGVLTVHQDVKIYVGAVGSGSEQALALGAGRHAWVQVLSGQVKVNDQALSEGDGAAVSDEQQLTFTATNDAADVMLFDLA